MFWMSMLALAAPGERLKVEAPCGDIRIIGGSKEIVVNRDAKVKRGKIVFDGPCEKFEIRVPRKTRLDIESLEANLEILNTLGDIDFESISGDIQVWGNVRPRSIEASTISGDLRIETSPDGDVTLSSVTGSTTVTGGPAVSVQVQSVNGPIDLFLELDPTGRLEAMSHDGVIRLTLPDEPAQFELRTLSGKVDEVLGPNDKGPVIELETFSSDIVLQPKEPADPKTDEELPTEPE